MEVERVCRSGPPRRAGHRAREARRALHRRRVCFRWARSERQHHTNSVSPWLRG